MTPRGNLRCWLRMAAVGVAIAPAAAMAAGPSATSIPVPTVTILQGDVLADELVIDQSVMASERVLRNYFTSREAVLGKVARRVLPKGHAIPINALREPHLFKEGEEATNAYLIRSGEVDLYRVADGTGRVMARVGAGSVLGDIAMFGGGRYISSAQAVGRVSAYRLKRDVLLPELANHPAVCMRWLVAGLRQLEETQRRVLHLMR